MFLSISACRATVIAEKSSYPCVEPEAADSEALALSSEYRNMKV